jgi:hypothetical protein
MEQDEEDQGDQQEERSPLAETSANVRRVHSSGASICMWCTRKEGAAVERGGKGDRLMRGHSLWFLA